MQQASFNDRKVVSVLDRRIEIAVRGQRRPLVVLESGLGDDLSPWSSVFACLAQRNKTFAYSRPGFGGSAAVCTPRNLCTETQELRQLLHALNEEPPYVLVGHSWGGLIVQAFAAAHPQEVSGLVLVDSAHPDLMERLYSGTPEDVRAFEAAAAEVYSEVAREELQALSAVGGGHFPGESTPFSGPMVILGAWAFDFNHSEAFQQQHRIRIQEIAAQYPQAELRKISCGHYIQRERPRAVIDAVDEVMARSAAAGRNG